MQALSNWLKAFVLWFMRVLATFRSLQRVHRKLVLSVDLERLTRELVILTCCSGACGYRSSFSMHEGTHDVELPDGSHFGITCSRACPGNNVDVHPSARFVVTSWQDRFEGGAQTKQMLS